MLPWKQDILTQNNERRIRFKKYCFNTYQDAFTYKYSILLTSKTLSILNLFKWKLSVGCFHGNHLKYKYFTNLCIIYKLCVLLHDKSQITKTVVTFFTTCMLRMTLN